MKFKTKYRVIKSYDQDAIKWYHAEKWCWYWPFWRKVSPGFKLKSDAIDFIPLNK